MNLKDLIYIIAVAETHHFGRAAERCFVSQPTLSGQIKKLEETLGVTIFERTNRSVEITPIGEAIVDHARKMVEQADAIKQLAQAHQDPLAGPLRIGAIPTISPYLLPLILKPLKKDFPQMNLVLSEEVTDTLLQRLHHHEIDAALLATEENEPGLDAMPLFKEPFWLAYGSKHELNRSKEIQRKDLERHDLLLLAEGHCLARQAMEVCHIRERSEQGQLADLRAASLETLMQLVEAGFGCTLVPALAANAFKNMGRDVTLHPLTFRHAYRRIFLIHRSTFPRKQALEALAHTITQSLPKNVELLR